MQCALLQAIMHVLQDAFSQNINVQLALRQYLELLAGKYS